MEVPLKTKNRTTTWFSNSTPGYISKSTENTNSKRYIHPNVHCSTIFNSQDMETTYVSINRWIKKKGYTHMRAHTHTHTQWNTINWLKKKGILPFATTWMDLEGIMLSGVSQTEKDKYYMISVIYGILKNKWTNITKQKQSHRYKEQAGGCQSGRGGRRREIGEGD